MNLSAYAFPLQRGKTVTIKSSGLKNGDYVKLVSSAKSSVLKAVKLKNGNIRLTAQRSTSKKAVAVKVLVTVDARGRVKGIRTGSAVITVKAGRAVYRTVIKVTK